MILNDKEIRARVHKFQKFELDSPMIQPFNEEKLQAASYDVQISNKIQRFRNEFRIIDLSVQDDINTMYEERDITDGFILSPREMIFVALAEKVNIPKDIVAHIRPRTRFTRLGLIVSDQHCNPTYKGRLKIGLTNMTPYAIKITPNLIIGQLVFEELSAIPSDSKLYINKRDAAYQDEDDFIGAMISEELKDKIDSRYEQLMLDMQQR